MKGEFHVDMANEEQFDNQQLQNPVLVDRYAWPFVCFPSEAETTLLDIAFERTDNVVDDSLSMDLTELWVFGIPGSDDGARFGLTKVSPRRWEATHVIEL
jgi:hypothetical protein